MTTYLSFATKPYAIELSLVFDRSRQSSAPLWRLTSHRAPVMTGLLNFAIDELFISAWRSIKSSVSNFFYPGQYNAGKYRGRRRRSKSTDLVPVTLMGNYVVTPSKGWWGKGY